MGKKVNSAHLTRTKEDPVDVGPVYSPFDDFDPAGELEVTRSAEGSVSVSPTNYMWLGVKVFCSVTLRCRKDQFDEASRVAIAAAVAEVSNDAEWVAPMWRNKSDNVKAALEGKWEKTS